MPVNPAETKFFAELEQQAIENPPKPLSEQTIEDARQGADMFSRYSGSVADVDAIDKQITARDGHQIPIRIFNHSLAQTTPVLVMYPGSGYIIDLFESNAVACSRIAKYSGIRVILVDYRIAPENPLPTAIHDAYDATKFIAQHAQDFQIDPTKLMIGGISSGAHCAAVVSKLAGDNDDFAIFHQILLNGLYHIDLDNRPSDYVEHEAQDKILPADMIRFIVKHWGVTEEDKRNPLFSPYHETKLTCLPATTLIVAEYDGLRSDTEAYYSKLKLANVAVEKIVLPGQTHNTMIMRPMMSDGEDPAKTIADLVIKLGNKKS